ncbi:cyclic 2,3-diphosphoglycerate synthase [candidate division CSSED10-310 bacterium]|uniref:Cyclic 2,3-diphosphoglycerate synthase n=1 Tax=candidate division CSSED10-310 bacterium TaxID=2855610 RepID=A0ABV6Z4M1_UNCC1
MSRKRILIMGAAGRDFHNFNTFFRDQEEYEVVVFTATQIPDIEGRQYPAELSGGLYPQGIPIESEENLSVLIRDKEIDIVVFSYSDVSHETVMHKASIVLSTGADFWFLGPKKTSIKSKKPVVSICAVRTGCGKSQTTRRVCEVLQSFGKKVVAIRHPMPYGNLIEQRVQRFSKLADLDTHKCTIEEREEYEPHINKGITVYAGVDYGDIIRAAEEEADVVVWDGGNNDLPFYQSDCHIVVVDPHRAGHELKYHPGEANLRLADAIVVNKIDSADFADIKTVQANIMKFAPEAVMIEAASPLFVDDPSIIRDKRVLVIEDGPTLTHGEMKYGAGIVAATKLGAGEIVDPRPFTVGSITETFQKYPEIGTLLPAMGYGDQQIKDLQETINNFDGEAVVIATPIDLRRLVKFNVPATRVRYELQEIGQPTLEDVLRKFSEKV